MMIKEFETARFLLRPIKSTDVEFAFENWTQEIDIAKYMTWMPHKKIEETKSFVSSCEHGWKKNDYTWLIEKKGTNEVVGSFAARKNAHKVDIGYLLLKKYWGQGYMPEVISSFVNEAFRFKDVYRVWAVCDVDNCASKRAMEKAGMKYEGLLKSWLVHPNMGDKPRDCHCLGITKEKA